MPKNCPYCGEELIQKETQFTIIWTCPSCGYKVIRPKGPEDSGHS